MECIGTGKVRRTMGSDSATELTLIFMPWRDVACRWARQDRIKHIPCPILKPFLVLLLSSNFPFRCCCYFCSILVDTRRHPTNVAYRLLNRFRVQCASRFRYCHSSASIYSNIIIITRWEMHRRCRWIESISYPYGPVLHPSQAGCHSHITGTLSESA